MGDNMKYKIISIIIVLILAIAAIGFLWYTMKNPEEIPLEAQATANPKDATINEDITFTGYASGGTPPYTYFWNFGSIGDSEDQNPTFIFSQEDIYTCKLIVTDSEQNTAEDTVQITVTDNSNPDLTVTASAYPTIVTLGNSVEFTTSVSGGTSPYSYQWSFGSTMKDPTHTFQTTGTKTCYVSVTDAESYTQTSDTITITVNPESVPEDPGLGFRPPTNINNGDEFWVDVYLDPPQATAGYEIDIAYDSSKLQVLEVIKGDSVWDLFNPGTTGNDIIESIYAVDLYTDISEAIDYKTDICKIKFKATSSGSVTLSFPYVSVSDLDAIEYTVQTNDKTITIE